MTELKDLPAHLETITKKQWKLLFELLDEAEHTTEFGIDRDGGNQMPWVEKKEIVTRFFNLVYELGIVTAFAWPKWKKGFTILETEGYDFTQLDKITLCKLITVHVRGDKFSEGNLVRAFESGQMQNILRALKEKVLK